MKKRWADPEYRARVGKKLADLNRARTKTKKFAVNHTVLFVEPWGIADVYNMHTPKYHNFVANGLVVHNCEVKINDVFNGKFRHLKTFPASVPVSSPEEWNDPEVRNAVHKTFIWGRVGEPRFVEHIGTEPEDWALERANRDPLKRQV